jgi:hypothetical protein
LLGKKLLPLQASGKIRKKYAKQSAKQISKIYAMNNAPKII